MSDPRQPHLEALGLTLWQRRGALPQPRPADADTDEVQARAHTSAFEPASQPEAQPAGPAAPASSTIDGVAARVSALDWDALAAHLATQDRRGASQCVFGTGARDADLLVIGAVPGVEEDRQGQPFVGPAGRLLDRLLYAIGRDRKHNAYITNLCKFRPPDGRDPQPDEVAADRPYLERQIELLAPKLIMVLGSVVAQALLGNPEELGQMRGRLHSCPGCQIPVLVTHDPGALLHAPQHKADVWADLKQALSCLEPLP